MDNVFTGDSIGKRNSRPYCFFGTGFFCAANKLFKKIFLFSVVRSSFDVDSLFLFC